MFSENVSWEILHLQNLKQQPTDVRRLLAVSSLGNIKYSRTKFLSMPELWFLEYTLNLTLANNVYERMETFYPARSVSRWTGRSIFMLSYFLLIRLGNCKYINDVSAVLVYQN